MAPVPAYAVPPTPKGKPPLTPDQGSEVEKRFQLFLQECKVNDHEFFMKIAKSMRKTGLSDIHINYEHLKKFDPALADVVSNSYERVKCNLVNASSLFLKEEFDWLVQYTHHARVIHSLTVHSYVPIKELWNSPGHHPAEEVDIKCGETTLRVTRTTPHGRIPFLSLLRKMFDSFENGDSWNGAWSIDDVMVDHDYHVEIMRPFCGECNYRTIRKDIQKCVEQFISEFKRGDELPCFFPHLRKSLELFIDQPHLTKVTWRRFRDFVLAHPALKAPLTRSTFYDNVHQMLQTLQDGAKDLAKHILNHKGHHTDWTYVLKCDSLDRLNPILAVVLEHNKKKKKKNERKNKLAEQKRKTEGANENDGTNAPVEVQQVEPVEEHKILTAELEQSLLAVMKRVFSAVSDLHAAVERPFPGAVNQVLTGTVESLFTAALKQPLSAVVEAPLSEDVNQPLATAVEEFLGAVGQNKTCADDEEGNPFEPTIEGLLIFARHIKQHGSKGSKDKKGKQQLKELSEIDLVMSHFLHLLPEILFNLIHLNDKEVNLFDPADQEKFKKMYQELFDDYNAPEHLADSDSHAELTSLPFLAHESPINVVVDYNVEVLEHCE